MTFAARRAPAFLAGLLVMPTAPAARASSFNVFQHGGRATAQAGAFTARAADPSAVTYNPAAIVRLDGLQLQAGLDFSAPVDEYRDSAGNFSARHVIAFPPALYATWHGDGSPVAFGLGIDAPVSFNNDWLPALFPGRFLAHSFELQLFELHAVASYALDDRWSLGGGLRYLYGQQEQTVNAIVAAAPFGPGVEAIAQADRRRLGSRRRFRRALRDRHLGLGRGPAEQLEGRRQPARLDRVARSGARHRSAARLGSLERAAGGRQLRDRPRAARRVLGRAVSGAATRARRRVPGVVASR